MGPPVAAGCGRNSEHPVLRFVPGDPGLRAPCAETHSLPPPERPARRPAPLGIGLASLSRTPRSWWPSPRLDGRLEVCPSQRHGLGTLIRPGAETRSSRPCSGPALLPDSVSPARRRDLLTCSGARTTICKTCERTRSECEATAVSPRGAQIWTARPCLMNNYLNALLRPAGQPPDRGPSQHCTIKMAGADMQGFEIAVLVLS